MRVFFKSALVLITGSIMVGTAFAGGSKTKLDVTAAKKIFNEGIYKDGKELVRACSGCHGVDAMGMEALKAPRLAGLGFTYIVKQLNNFAEIKRVDRNNAEKVEFAEGDDTTANLKKVFDALPQGKKDAIGQMGVMNKFASNLTDQQRREMAAYFSVVQTKFQPSTKSEIQGQNLKLGDSSRGKVIALEGIASKGVSACKSCHGWNGIGRAPMYPRIGQQRYAYLVSQLEAWKKGSEGGRDNDFAAQMRQVAKGLSEQDILDVASYLVKAPVTTRGNDRVPDYTSLMTHNYEIVGIDQVNK